VSVALAIAAGGFAGGYLAINGFDLVLHRNRLAGARAERRGRVEGHRRRGLLGDRVTVLAGGTALEERVEAWPSARRSSWSRAWARSSPDRSPVDNLSESSASARWWAGSIAAADGGHGARCDGRDDRCQPRAGDRRLAPAAGAPRRGGGPPARRGRAGMRYLTITQLIPPGEERRYQGSSALASGGGLRLMLVIAQLA
jgi:hypothetical protein